jgi:hypothetical protein
MGTIHSGRGSTDVLPGDIELLARGSDPRISDWAVRQVSLVHQFSPCVTMPVSSLSHGVLLATSYRVGAPPQSAVRAKPTGASPSSGYPSHPLVWPPYPWALACARSPLWMPNRCRWPMVQASAAESPLPRRARRRQPPPATVQSCLHFPNLRLGHVVLADHFTDGLKPSSVLP